MALGHHRPLRGKGAVDQAEVGVADAAECHLDQHLAGSRLGDRNILECNGFRVGIKALGAHRVSHGRPPVLSGTKLRRQPALVVTVAIMARRLATATKVGLPVATGGFPPET